MQNPFATTAGSGEPPPVPDRAPDPLTPYFHPTTVCFVDDNESFLTGLELMLPSNMNAQSFYNPRVALEFVNQPGAPSLADRCFSQQQQANGTLFELNTGLIEDEIYHPERFARVSAVIVDYSMPILNGLDFCEQVTDPNIGKVLLTGVADEKLAVEAFNAGIIDRFISKSHPQAMARISEFSLSLQQAYFAKQAQQLQRTLGLSETTFLNDPEVAAFVRRLQSSRGFCEYYLMSDPQGLMLLKPNGDLQLLLLMRKEQIAQQAEFAASNDAPASVTRRLGKSTHIGYFSEPFDAPYPWSTSLYRARHIGKHSGWYAALVKQPPLPIDYEPQRLSFRQHVAEQ